MEGLPQVRIIKASNGWVLEARHAGDYEASGEVKVFGFGSEAVDGQLNSFAAVLSEVDRQIGVTSEAFSSSRISINVLGVIE
tara:strand:- start:566 stop:811 length:246 start_codon:yes stop_codon:yes gene_type:complete